MRIDMVDRCQCPGFSQWEGVEPHLGGSDDGVTSDSSEAYHSGESSDKFLQAASQLFILRTT